MTRKVVIAWAAALVLSANVQAGELFDVFKQSLGNVAEDVKKDLEYTIDQTLRNTFPALETAGDPEDAPSEFSGEVVVFGFDSCPYCMKVESLLKEYRVIYKDMDVQKSKTAERKWKELGGRGVPITVIGDQAIPGWSEEKILALLHEQGFI